MSNTPGMGGNDGTGTGTGEGQGESQSLADVISAAWDDVDFEANGSDERADATTNNGDADRARAEQAAAVASANKDPQETPAAAADKGQTAPNPWTEADAAQLAALSPEVQNLVAKRIASVEAEATQKASADVELAGGVRQIVERNGFADVLRRSGMNEVQGVEYLANLERFAREKPADYLAFVAQTVQGMGVDVAKVLGLGAPAPEGQPADDAFTDPRMGQFEERLTRFERSTTEAAQRTAMDNAGREIATFRDAKGQDGKPLRPYLAEVENDMAALIKANRNLTLEQAYESAIWSNPAVRTKVLAEQDASKERKARSEAANAAKATKANIRSGQRPAAPAPNIRNSQDAVRAALEGVDI